MDFNQTSIDHLLTQIELLDIPLNLINDKLVKKCVISDQELELSIEFPFPANSIIADLKVKLEREFKTNFPDKKLNLNLTAKIISRAVQRGLKPLPGVKNIIAVASGKGGVGKSTTAANLALALAAEGARVGVLDADIYGPSQPMIFGVSGQPETKDGQTMEPKIGHGIQLSSIGFMIDPDEPMVWRGPMVVQALQQLLNQTNWQDLDYLIVDMPPGTGDIQLSLSQKVPVTGAIIVTTPQDLALLDARKGLRMFEKVGIPILGIVENMSTHICSQCGHEEAIFGSGGADKMGVDFSTKLLGRLPLNIEIRTQTDAGVPTVVANPDGPLARHYRQIALQVAHGVALQAADHSHKFPTISIKAD